MTTATFTYTIDQGWSVDTFPLLDSPHTFVLVFGHSRYLDHAQPFDDLAAAYPQAVRLGCSTAGEILGPSLQDESLVVAVCKLVHTPLRIASVPLPKPEASFEAGVAIGEQLRAPDLKGIFVLSEGCGVNGCQLVNGLKFALSSDVTVVGGLAGDGSRFERTWVLANEQRDSGMVGAIGFYGDRIHLGNGSGAGWSVFGPERKITASQDNVLYELDGKPALELYKNYLGDHAKGLPATGFFFPLAIETEQSKGIIRTVLGVTEADQSLTFAGDMPVGDHAQFMMANIDRLIGAASKAASKADLSLTHPPLSVTISCAGRRMVLGERAEEELEMTLDALPAGTQQVGFYAYGEIASDGFVDHCGLHNQTMIVFTIAEI